MERKNVIFVNSLFNMILAVQLRKSLYGHEQFDVLVSNVASGLKEIYDSHELENIFDHVYYVDYKKLNKFVLFKGVIKPEYIWNSVIEDYFIEYENIFFWNPTRMLHYYLMELNRRRKPYKLHVYADAAGGYITDCPVEKGIFRFPVFNDILSKKYGYKPICRQEYDYYLFSPQYMGYESLRPIREIPLIDYHDEKIRMTYNKIFHINESYSITEKFIFMDVNQTDQFQGRETGLDYIKTVIKSVEKQNLVLKPHPRQNLEIYKDLKIKIITLIFPWEVYCINHSIDEKVIIAFGTSSAFLPYVLFNTNHTVVYIDEETELDKLYGVEWEEFIKKLIEKGKKIYIVQNKEELGNTLKIIQQKF